MDENGTYEIVTDVEILDDPEAARLREKKKRKEKRALGRARGFGVMSVILGAVSLVITVLRILLLPISLGGGAITAAAISSTGIPWLTAFIFSPAMLDGVIGAMAILLMLLIALVGLAVEFLPIELGALALLFAVISARGRKRSPEGARNKKGLKRWSFTLSVIALALGILAEGILIIPSIIAAFPLIEPAFALVRVYIGVLMGF